MMHPQPCNAIKSVSYHLLPYDFIYFYLNLFHKVHCNTWCHVVFLHKFILKSISIVRSHHLICINSWTSTSWPKNFMIWWNNLEHVSYGLDVWGDSDLFLVHVDMHTCRRSLVALMLASSVWPLSVFLNRTSQMFYCWCFNLWIHLSLFYMLCCSYLKY